MFIIDNYQLVIDVKMHPKGAAVKYWRDWGGGN